MEYSLRLRSIKDSTKERPYTIYNGRGALTNVTCDSIESTHLFGVTQLCNQSDKNLQEFLKVHEKF